MPYLSHPLAPPSPLQEAKSRRLEQELGDMQRQIDRTRSFEGLLAREKALIESSRARTELPTPATAPAPAPVPANANEPTHAPSAAASAPGDPSLQVRALRGVQWVWAGGHARVA